MSSGSGRPEVGNSSVRTKQAENLAMLLILALLLLSLGASKINAATLPDNTTDLLSLRDFRQGITNDPTGILNSWNSPADHCTWEGITCSRTHPGRIIALELGGLNLAGQISPSIGNLTFLNTLNLSANSLSGLFPPLNKLHRLQILDLSSNSLDDIIPDGLTNCSSLTALYLGRNSLVGEIPSKLGLLSNLSVIWLSKNNLTGTIPPTLGNITHIQKIYLDNNYLTGSIPDELGNLTDLSDLGLGVNNLTGTIPCSIFNMLSLQTLGLESNMLTGTAFPPKVALPNLQWITIGGNMFSEGEIPASLGNSTRIEYIDLSSNNLTGQIPSFFGTFLELYNLNLKLNNLEARDIQDFFHGLTNCSNLQVLSLAYNRLQGVLPNSIGNLSTGLEQLLLGANDLSGFVPSTIGDLQGLFQLGLSQNNFTGTIVESVGNLINLQYLSLGGNNFMGQIPSSLGNLTKLAILFLYENKLTGFVPRRLGNLQHMLKLSLSYNNLQGSIPVEFGNLEQLILLNISSNEFSGEIPQTLGYCQQFVTIQMDQNVLTGNIPVTFSNLKSLTLLNLSHNNLSGTIPVAISNLQLLTKLDLSYNHLQGEIPQNGFFENATSIYLDGNMGLCGGVMDLHFPSCPAVSQKILRNYNLVRLLIPIFGFISLILTIYIISNMRKTSRKTYLILLSFGKKFPRVSYNDLAQATRNFSESNLIGKGSYGSVYRGKLTQAKIQVAIKVFDLEVRCADKCFLSECEALRNIRHRSLLPILTACSTIDNKGNDFKALIYEFMPNGNLDTWLHGSHVGVAPKHLGLAQRINIAIGIADALAYLHHDSGGSIVHCDIKPTNILLDDGMNAHLGDFGIASLNLDSTSTPAGYSGSNISIAVKGTIGYIAPEYAQSVRASTCGDTYSFGIVLLEMLTGKRPTDSMFDNGLNIVNFTDMNFPGQILDIIDAHLQDEFKGSIHTTMERESTVYQCLQSFTQVALSCTRLVPRERLNMREVANKLHAIGTLYVKT